MYVRAFPGLCSRNVVRPPARRPPQQPSSSSKSKKKKPMLGYVPLTFQPLETWTKEICILGRCDEDKTPDRQRLYELSAAGLGKAKIVFPNKKASHEEVERFLHEKFPKLKSAGGFEVLRGSGGGGGQRSLSLLAPSREGYSIPHLKERLGQAIAFIRPLQVDLDETPVTTENADSPKVACVNCHLLIPMTQIREHQEECAGGGSSHHSAKDIAD
ncbi:hypothetical protein OS493_036105 [Desmophyllum pertusum]|uniref:Uncharacterized protein n=1 Tax=Desmophyllum pertusum TaxID=174260 RepID=A0A9W9YAM7_9CNID|nr:hypothetical protein OS493_036105 [Desmophyllum pertusum]